MNRGIHQHRIAAIGSTEPPGRDCVEVQAIDGDVQVADNDPELREDEQLGRAARGKQMATVKSLDIRWDAKAPEYEVGFVSRRPTISPVSAGHAFVRITKAGDAASTISFGLYPDGSMVKAVLAKVPNKIADDDWKSKGEIYVAARISSRQFAIVEATVNKWIGGNYTLIYEDCTTFALEIAGNLMLKQPLKGGLDLGNYLPHSLMEKLSSINTQTDCVGGEWKSTDAQNRWMISTRDLDADVRERASSGATLPSKLDIKLETFDLGGGTQTSWRIERPNTADVLRFLGAKEALINPILALGPKPSYFILKRTSAAVMELAWYGLVWRLKADGSLAGIDQPGSGAPKLFPLQRTF